MNNTLVVEPYQTPPGKVDFPFAYVLNNSALTNGQTYHDIQKQLQGDSDFILRHIAGVPLCIATSANGGRWNYKNASRTYAIANPSTGIYGVNNWVVVPEKKYPINSSIYVDLYDVLVDVTACGGTPIPNAFIAFFGVKRFNQGQYAPRVTPYRYKELSQRYEFQLTIDWAHFASGTAVAPPQRKIVQMDNYDFELIRISVGQSGSDGTVVTNDFQMTLYDPGMHQMSDLPLNQGFFNCGKPTPQTQAPYQGLFPTPSIVYPAGGQITFDVTSMLCGTDLPQTYDISFEGIWRKPC